ncbi:hypothetical protein B0A89_13100 [Paracoccus contaminans]|uniref:Uncharacterized protein n=2 Tax=Paracoccus contaminans TaxID=1945662 RepID=A0A1W6CZX5_9RHOB|nr:hypothetical protein B0A89_13100 [Paracoccus contaminans]
MHRQPTPYGHMLTTIDAARELRRLGLLTEQEWLGLRIWLDSRPQTRVGEVVPPESPSPHLLPALRKAMLVSLMPATWTVQ